MHNFPVLSATHGLAHTKHWTHSCFSVIIPMSVCLTDLDCYGQQSSVHNPGARNKVTVLGSNNQWHVLASHPGYNPRPHIKVMWTKPATAMQEMLAAVGFKAWDMATMGHTYKKEIYPLTLVNATDMSSFRAPLFQCRYIHTVISGGQTVQHVEEQMTGLPAKEHQFRFTGFMTLKIKALWV